MYFLIYGQKNVIVTYVVYFLVSCQERGIFPIRSDSWKIIVDTAIVASRMYVIQI